MKQKFFAVLALVGALFLSSNSMAADTTSTTANKPISKVTDVNNMADDSIVYIQGYIVQNLGDDNYLFRDESGTINIEIDDDLIEGNNIVPNAVVFITATVDKDDNITSLEAEEIQFVPTGNTPDQHNN